MKGIIRGGSHTKKEDKELLEQLERERVRLENEKRLKLAQFNQQTREANRAKSRTNPHRAAWGVDQRQFSPGYQKTKQREVEEERHKRREQREKVQREGRTRIGLDLIPDFKYPEKQLASPKAPSRSPPHKHTTKKTDQAVLDFMHEKRRKALLAARQKALTDQELEDKRSKALALLQSHQRQSIPRPKLKRKKKKSSKSKSTSKAHIQPLSETPPDKNLYRKLRDLLKTKAQQLRDAEDRSRGSSESDGLERHMSLLQKMEELSAKLEKTKVLMTRESLSRGSKGEKEEITRKERSAAVKIQRFLRKVVEKRKILKQKGGGEKTLQLSEVESPGKEKEGDSDTSLKSFGSFLGRKVGEARRPADSLDLLVKENLIREEAEDAKPDLVDHFRSSLTAHYLQLTQHTLPLPPPADVAEDQSLLNTLRSSAAADDYVPATEESLGWDQHPVQRVEVPPSESPSPREFVHSEPVQNVLIIEDTVEQPAIPETGGSPNDSYNLEDPSHDFASLHERASPTGDSPPLSDYMGETPRSLDDFFATQMPAEEADSPRYPAASLRIPTGRRLALDLGRMTVPPELSSAEVSGEESPSIGSLIRGGPESPEVLSFRDNVWREIKSEQVEWIVQEVIERECEAITELVAPYVMPVDELSDPMADFILTFLDLLLAELLPREFQFMHKFSHPRPVDSLQVLSSITSSSPLPIQNEVLVPDSVYRRICNQINVSSMQIEENPLFAPCCHLMIDLVNETLDLLRPESVKGEPPPWRQGSRDTKQYPGVESVLCDVRDLLLFWNQAQVGQMLDDESPENIAQIQEELGNNQLMRDVRDRQMLTEESGWVDYEFKEVHVKLDLADSILGKLIEETMEVLGQ